MTRGATAIREVQSLLRVLAAGRNVAEMGAAYGETAAVMAETARSVVTVELDPERAAVARERLAACRTSSCSRGTASSSCEDAAPSGSCSSTAGSGRCRSRSGTRSSLSRSLAASSSRPTCRRGGRSRATRSAEFLLRDPRLAGAKILATPEMAVIVSVKLP